MQYTFFFSWQKHHKDKVVDFCHSYCQNKLHGKVGESVTVLIEKEMHIRYEHQVELK